MILPNGPRFFFFFFFFEISERFRDLGFWLKPAETGLLYRYSRYSFMDSEKEVFYLAKVQRLIVACPATQDFLYTLFF